MHCIDWGWSNDPGPSRAGRFPAIFISTSDYRLFQTADLFCSMELVRLKVKNNIVSASEMEFFGNLRDLKKNYLKPLHKKEWI